MNLLKIAVINCILFLNIGCLNNSRDSTYGILDIHFRGKDTCVFFANQKNIYRNLVIIENNLKDTVLCGYNVIPPSYTGKILYLQINDKKDKLLYFEQGDDVRELPKTDRICFHRYRNSNAVGRIKIKYFYEASNK